MKAPRYYSKPYAGTLRDIVRERSHLKFSPKDSLSSIMKRLHDNHMRAGGVIDAAGRFIGLITETEIARRVFGRFEWPHHNPDYLSEHKEISQMTSWDVMIMNPDTLHLDDEIEDALELITYFGYSHMPVVGSDGKLCGIISAKELRHHVKIKEKALRASNDSLPLHVISGMGEGTSRHDQWQA